MPLFCNTCQSTVQGKQSVDNCTYCEQCYGTDVCLDASHRSERTGSSLRETLNDPGPRYLSKRKAQTEPARIEDSANGWRDFEPRRRTTNTWGHSEPHRQTTEEWQNFEPPRREPPRRTREDWQHSKPHGHATDEWRNFEPPSRRAPVPTAASNYRGTDYGVGSTHSSSGLSRPTASNSEEIHSNGTQARRLGNDPRYGDASSLLESCQQHRELSAVVPTGFGHFSGPTTRSHRDPYGRAQSSTRASAMEQLLREFYGERLFPGGQNVIIMSPSAGAHGDFILSGYPLNAVAMAQFIQAQQGPCGPPPIADSNLSLLTTVTDPAAAPEDDCPVCQCELVGDEEVTKLPCEHHYHKECIVTWLRMHNSCPVCRTPVERG